MSEMVGPGVPAPGPVAASEENTGRDEISLLTEWLAELLHRLSTQDVPSYADRDLVRLTETLGRAVLLAKAHRLWRLEQTVRDLGPVETCRRLGISRQRLSQLVPMKTRKEMPARLLRKPGTIRARIVRDYESGKTMAWLSERYRKGYPAIRAILDDAGVEIRR